MCYASESESTYSFGTPSDQTVTGKMPSDIKASEKMARWFVINNRTGEISIAGQLDATERYIYDIPVAVTNKGRH